MGGKCCKTAQEDHNFHKSLEYMTSTLGPSSLPEQGAGGGPNLLEEGETFQASDSKLGNKNEAAADKKAEPGGLGTAIAMKFPMWVMRCRDAMELTEVIAHQDLLEKGLLVEWEEGMGPVLFVSHQWVGGGHPDPKFQQFACLVRILKKMQTGALSLASDVKMQFVENKRIVMGPSVQKFYAENGFIWYDYFAVPQPGARPNDPTVIPKLMAAVYSIPAYVENSEEFIILVPRVFHVTRKGEMCNYMSWQMRGWCRVELLTRNLTWPNDNIICAESENMCKFQFSIDWMYRAPGDGEFTEPNDKKSVCAVVEQIFEAKIQQLRKAAITDGDQLVLLRWFLGRRDYFRKGLGEYQLTSDQFLKDCGFELPLRKTNTGSRLVSEFSDEVESAMPGLGPILLATFNGTYSVMKQVVDLKFDVNETNKKQRMRIGLNVGTTILMSACTLDPVPHSDSVASIKLLLDRKAHINAVEAFGTSAISYCCIVDQKRDVIELMIERKADINMHNPGLGGTPMLTLGEYATDTGCIENILEPMIRAKADLSSRTSNKTGSTVMILCCMYNRYFLLPYLIEQKADIDAGGVNRLSKTRGAYKAMGWLARKAVRKGLVEPNNIMVEMFAMLEGMTCLQVACYWGSTECIKILLDAKADHNLRDYMGRTPLELAQEYKNTTTAAVLSEYLGEVENDLATGSQMLAPTEVCADWAELVKMNDAGEEKAQETV